MKLKIGDYFIISVILIAAFIMFLPKKKSGDKAIVLHDGREIASFDLSQDTEYDFKDIYINKIIVKDGYIYINDADCPDKTCVHSGKISKSGQTICCLPNKLIIRIVSDSSKVDVISG